MRADSRRARGRWSSTTATSRPSSTAPRCHCHLPPKPSLPLPIHSHLPPIFLPSPHSLSQSTPIFLPSPRSLSPNPLPSSSQALAPSLPIHSHLPPKPSLPLSQSRSTPIFLLPLPSHFQLLSILRLPLTGADGSRTSTSRTTLEASRTCSAPLASTTATATCVYL